MISSHSLTSVIHDVLAMRSRCDKGVNDRGKDRGSKSLLHWKVLFLSYYGRFAIKATPSPCIRDPKLRNSGIR